jgi:transposase InsO family protein
MQPLQVGSPLQRITTDILDEFPETENGNRYVIVISDYFNKWTETFPMRNMEAQTVARNITNEDICRFGCPETIHSDQGRQYESLLFDEVCRLLEIQKTRTTPYHLQSNGMMKRFNKTLATMLSASVNENHLDWDESIPYVMKAYRASQHESTDFSPNMLILGREVTTPLDIMVFLVCPALGRRYQRMTGYGSLEIELSIHMHW